jgi:hypothetical protein
MSVGRVGVPSPEPVYRSSPPEFRSPNLDSRHQACYRVRPITRPLAEDAIPFLGDSSPPGGIAVPLVPVPRPLDGIRIPSESTGISQLVAQALRIEFCFTERRQSTAEGLFGARYVLPPAYRSCHRGRRVALVDDVMSAGSALRGSYAELKAYDAVAVVAGALLILGDLGANFFVQERVPLVAVLREPYELWSPEACPLCRAGMSWEVGAGARSSWEQPLSADVLSLKLSSSWLPAPSS